MPVTNWFQSVTLTVPADAALADQANVTPHASRAGDRPRTVHSPVHVSSQISASVVFYNLFQIGINLHLNRQ